MSIPDEMEGGELDCQGEAFCRGDVIANITPEGIELRFPVGLAPPQLISVSITDRTAVPVSSNSRTF